MLIRRVDKREIEFQPSWVTVLPFPVTSTHIIAALTMLTFKGPIIVFLVILLTIPQQSGNTDKHIEWKQVLLEYNYCSHLIEMVESLNILWNRGSNVVGSGVDINSHKNDDPDSNDCAGIHEYFIRSGDQYSITNPSNQSLALYSSSFAIYFPLSKSHFTQILRERLCHTTNHLKARCPTTLIRWPFTIMSNETRNICYKNALIRSLLHNVTTKKSRFCKISDDIYFIFKIECKHSANASISWSVWEAYSLLTDDKGEDNFKMDEVLYRSPNSFFNYLMIRTKLQRRSNLHQTLIRAVAPFFKEIKLEVEWAEDLKTGEIKPIGGMAVNILKELQKLLNFSLKIIPGDFSVPTSQERNNSTYKPVTADLMNLRQVEIMIGHTTPTPGRLHSVDVLFPSSYNRLWAYVHQPPASYARDMFSYPFQPKLWVAFGITWTLLLIATKICIKILNTLTDTFDHFPNVIFWSVATIAQKASDRPPTSTQLRLTFYLTTFLTTVCFNAYSAAIVSILSREEIPIPDLQSLFRSSLQIKAAFESSNVAGIIKGLQSVGKINPNTNPFLRTPEGVSKLFRNPCAFISYDHLFHFERQNENISEVEYCSKVDAFPLTRTHIATSMTMPKNSPLRELFNHKLLRLSERGLLSRHQRVFHLRGGVQCLKSEIPYKFPLAVDDLFTAFLISLLGFLISPTILLGELLSSRMNLQKV